MAREYYNGQCFACGLRVEKLYALEVEYELEKHFKSVDSDHLLLHIAIAVGKQGVVKQ